MNMPSFLTAHLKSLRRPTTKIQNPYNADFVNMWRHRKMTPLKNNIQSGQLNKFDYIFKEIKKHTEI